MEDVDKRRRFFPGYKKTNIRENIELLLIYSSIGRVHCSETTEETTLTFYQQISFAVLVGTKI